MKLCPSGESFAHASGPGLPAHRRLHLDDGRHFRHGRRGRRCSNGGDHGSSRNRRRSDNRSFHRSLRRELAVRRARLTGSFDLRRFAREDRVLRRRFDLLELAAQDVADLFALRFLDYDGLVHGFLK
jgi:hypothetical protein